MMVRGLLSLITMCDEPMMQSWIGSFIQKATIENEILRENGAQEAARARERLLTELSEAAPKNDELLTLAVAARESGYAPRTLRRMLDDGRLTNYGRVNRPLVRRCDLPRRAIGLREPMPIDNLETAKGRIAKSVINPRVYDDDKKGETI
jgi:hypothetical protein